MTHIHVRPARADLRVPTGAHQGEYFPSDQPTLVVRSRYIERRLADGDLVEVTPVATDAAPKKPRGE